MSETTVGGTHAPAPAAAVHDERRYPPPRGWVDPDTTKSWIRRLLPIVVAHRGAFAFALVATVLGSLMQVLAPRVVMEAIDSLVETDGDALITFIWILVALAVGRIIFGYASRYGLFRVASGIEYDLRSMIYEHITRLSFSFYDRVQTGQLISRANSDVRAVHMFLTFVPIITVTMGTFLVALGLMFQVHVGLTLVALLPLPGVLWFGIRMRKLIFPISWIIQARLADVATLVEENVTGVRIVKSFAAEAQQIRNLVTSARRLQWAAVRQADVRARYAPLLENLPRLGLVLVLLVGGWLAIEEQVTIGAIFAFSAYVVMLQAPFRVLGFLLMLAQRARASAQRIFEVMNEQPDVADHPDATALESCEGRVAFRNVVFSYEDRDSVLDGFDLEFAPGEKVALVGRTGCGKSTVARLLMRFYDVDDGAVLVDGHDIRDLTQHSLRSHVGLVPDDAFLFTASIRDNIAYSDPDAPHEAIVAAARAAGAEEFIQDLPQGYETVVGERGYTLSGGQRQRIAIARTLLDDPAILILDDATSSVDVQVEEEIHAALRVLLGSRTTLIIAHRLSTIGLADRVALIEGGRVVATGTHTDLLRAEPRYADVLATVQEEDVQVEERRPPVPVVDLNPDSRARRDDLPSGFDANGFPL